MKNKRNKKDCKLLPYDRENVYGLSTSSGQYCGWEISKFNIKEKWKNSKGEGVVVAVIDTGCDLYHDDLKKNIVQGKNFLENKDPIDRNGHGTHVSGTIAAIDNGLGMVGVAPETKIMPLKALNDDGVGDSRAIAEAIVWAADHSVDFITMSLGSDGESVPIKKAIDYACSKNVVIFCAAGNAGERAPIMYPAKYSNVISIGAIDKNLERTPFTCSGEELDFLAPGHEIVSAIPGNAYATMSGTSMSNPFAVGCASLLLSNTRKISAMDGMLKTADDYINVFKKKSKNLTNPRYAGQKQYEGYGIIYPVLQ
jgi:subtilisin family serine protease